MIDVAIIGAGPYGLSIAAHLKARGVEFRIFGSPMRTWLVNMPKGMRLKSDGFASSLYDPDSAFTLGRYCQEKGIPYADQGLPVPLETFSSYGLEFQKRFVPELENTLVVSVDRVPGGFQIRLADGEVVATRRIVNAVGLSYFEHVPPALAELPEEFVTHSSRHSTLDHFKGRELAVVGAGASAVDLAALLHEAGASVQLVGRKARIRFHDPPKRIPAALLERIRYPMTGIGTGWKLVFCASAPLVFRQLSERYRFDAVRRLLGPAPGWFVKDQVVGKVPFNLGVSITQAKVQNGRVSLQLTDGSGGQRTLVTDHVIAATGYKVDLRRLTFLHSDIQAGIQCVEHTPVLSSNFESSVPGLYFVGTAAANTFGPLLRFAVGARFTARRLARHLERAASRTLVRSRSAYVGHSNGNQ
jgi:thioredoxin reductase